MSGSYSFLPWLRQGLARRITAADGSVAFRASVRVDMELGATGLDGAALPSQPLGRDIDLFGPGDIVGIEKSAIVRTDPRPSSTNFEPNYLPTIEFYDEDFPWRYTPAAPDGSLHRLRPWIALIVLKEGEFKDDASPANAVAKVIRVTDRSVFPPADQLWAWAHVHVNRGITSNDKDVIDIAADSIAGRMEAVLDDNADLAYSRLICPRKLETNAAYHAFVVPAFEGGRLAGLDHDPSTAPHATFSAWADYPDGQSKPDPELFPFYHRWYFRTGGVGDFEYLVRLVRPMPVDPAVGRRNVDVQRPGGNLPGLTDPALGGVLALGGALRVPGISLSPEAAVTIAREERWDDPYPHPFQTKLGSLINLAEHYERVPTADANRLSGLDVDVQNDPDPLITPPLYGRWLSLTRRLLTDAASDPVTFPRSWVHELNLDPRHRMTAAFGTAVIQDRQEEYMNAAWGQIGDVLEANRRIKAAQLATEVSSIWHERHIRPIVMADPDRAFAVMAPLARRVLSDGATVQERVRSSTIATAPLSAAMRRITRPGSRLMRALPFTAEITRGNLLTRIASRVVFAAPPKIAPEAIFTTVKASAALLPASAPGWVVSLLRQWPSLPIALPILLTILLIVLWLIGVGTIAVAIVGALVVAAAVIVPVLRHWATSIQAADALDEDRQIPVAVDALPHRSDFRVTPAGPVPEPTRGGPDSADATRFKAALKGWFTLRVASVTAGAEQVRAPIDVPAATLATFTAIDPRTTIRRRTLDQLRIPDRIRGELDDKLQEVLAYPVIDTPMYGPLAAKSSEYFLPNLHLVAENSITILESNQKFIEAFMIGLNHEMARELLWRGFPTDQRGTCFRQFWDPRGRLEASGSVDEATRERLRDIPPIHTWRRASHLGNHDQRWSADQPREEIVLVIRGELLKRYPNAVIYAHRAEWRRKPDGSIDPGQERALVAIGGADGESPPRQSLRTPQFEAKIEPDVYFIGFDLTAADVRGGDGTSATDSPGWFFVIHERPGEPRFGLDNRRDGALNVWNDLTWDDAKRGIQGGEYLDVAAGMPAVALVEPIDPSVAEKHDQWNEDRRVAWNQDTNAADLAYILYQAPVRVAIHGAEMLRAPRR